MPRDEIIGLSYRNESMHAVDTAALIRRLEDFALGNGEEMSDGEVCAALSALDRVIPSLVEVEVRVREERRAKGSRVRTNNTPLVKG